MVSVALHERTDFIQAAQTASYLGHNFKGGVGILRADRRGIVPIRDSPVTQAEGGRTGDGTITVRGSLPGRWTVDKTRPDLRDDRASALPGYAGDPEEPMGQR
jgi:hypothetical protein